MLNIREHIEPIQIPCYCSRPISAGSVPMNVQRPQDPKTRNWRVPRQGRCGVLLRGACELHGETIVSFRFIALIVELI